jgi:proteic killer suppression protein
MIQSFKNAGAEDIFNGRSTQAARRICPQSLWKIATHKLDQLDPVTAIYDLQIPPGNRLEALRGDRQGQQSIVLMIHIASVSAGRIWGQPT